MASLQPFGRRRMSADDVPTGDSSFPSPDDAFLSCSWPAVTPSRLRPEPPKAPLRRPSVVSWEVPPLKLPAGAKGVTAKRVSGSLPSESTEFDDFFAIHEDEEKDNEEEETCVFTLDMGGGGRSRVSSGSGVGNSNHDDGHDDDENDDYAAGGGKRFQYEMVGLDVGMEDLDLGDGDDGEEKAIESFGMDVEFGKRSRGSSFSPDFGTSPSLMSALEHVAAEVRNPYRSRFASM